MWDSKVCRVWEEAEEAQGETGGGGRGSEAMN